MDEESDSVVEETRSGSRRRPRRHDEYPETLFTRFVAAAVTMFFVAVTIGAFALFMTFETGRSGFGASLWALDWLFSRWTLIPILAAGAFAFAAGGDRALDLLSALWGTNEKFNQRLNQGINDSLEVEPEWLEEHPFVIATILIAVALLIWFLIHRT